MRLFGGKQFGLGIVAMAVLFSWLSVAQGSEPLVADTSNSFAETQVAFSKKPAELQGTLTLPTKRNGKVPGIVFVGGDEPQNRTVPAGTEQMFADLARGLAQAGIASLRYQQRPFEFSAPADPKQLPLDQQIANDALAALAYLGHLPEIDSSAIFVVGHHGGYHDVEQIIAGIQSGDSNHEREQNVSDACLSDVVIQRFPYASYCDAPSQVWNRCEPNDSGQQECRRRQYECRPQITGLA